MKDYDSRIDYREMVKQFIKKSNEIQSELPGIAELIYNNYFQAHRGTTYYDESMDFIIIFGNDYGENGDPRAKKEIEEVCKKYGVDSKNVVIYKGTWCCVIPSKGKNKNLISDELNGIWFDVCMVH